MPATGAELGHAFTMPSAGGEVKWYEPAIRAGESYGAQRATSQRREFWPEFAKVIIGPISYGPCRHMLKKWPINGVVEA